tara:strand:+ start:1363 stop:1758 length:396 start_codon:yes stop_codon:yes gene_type:complete
MSTGYIKLARGTTLGTEDPGLVAKPASGATITLWSSASNQNSSFGGPRFKRLIVSIYSSHASAASGLAFQESHDGTNWRDLVSYSISATTYTRSDVAVAAPYVRVRYTNSANTLTTWEMSVLGDCCDRAAA